jgi:hypothetical protein
MPDYRIAMQVLQERIGQEVEIYSLWNGHAYVERGILRHVNPYRYVELGDEQRTHKSQPFAGNDVIRLIFDRDGQCIYAAEIPDKWWPASEEKITQLRAYMFGKNIADEIKEEIEQIKKAVGLE